MKLSPSEGRPAFEGIKTAAAVCCCFIALSEGRPAFEGIKTRGVRGSDETRQSEGRPAFEGIKTCFFLLASWCWVRRQTRFRGD